MGGSPTEWAWPGSATSPSNGRVSARCWVLLHSSDISNRVSADDGLRFRETGFRGPETTPRNPLVDRFGPCRDKTKHNKCPPIRRHSAGARKSPVARDWVVGPGVVTHANSVNGLRVKQHQKAPLKANGFLRKCQNLERYLRRRPASPGSRAYRMHYDVKQRDFKLFESDR